MSSFEQMGGSILISICTIYDGLVPFTFKNLIIKKTIGEILKWFQTNTQNSPSYSLNNDIGPCWRI